jgi:A-factor type gamma-butyrolactone 1'-reductase (1S-forming)
VGTLTGRVAFVTGGTAGIGAAVARVLGAAGAYVVVAGRRGDAARSVLDDLAAQGASGEFVAMDVTSTAQVDAAVAAAAAVTGRLDIAVNSAGVFDRMRPMHTYGDDEWDALMTVNLTGVFRCLRAELATMHTTGGSIVNIASTVGHRGSLRASAGYVAAKHAVIGLTRQAALGYVDCGIRVNSVSPGPTLTDMAAPLVAEGPEAVRAALAPLNPMATFIHPDQVAHAVAYLCSDEAATINGADIVLDGGQLARL